MVTTRSETIRWRHKESIAVACSLFEGLFNGGVSCLLDLGRYHHPGEKRPEKKEGRKRRRKGILVG